MRQADTRRRYRNGVCCFLAGLLVIEIVLSASIESRWVEVRDAAYADLVAIVHERRREMPERPLAMILGSSSTFMGLDGARISQPGDVLFLNGAISGTGPMDHQIVLRRLLADGIRPDLLFVEIMPNFFGRAKGDRVGFEERDMNFNASRFTFSELTRA